MHRIGLHPPPWQLIVNADDLGIDAARDAGILALAGLGQVSSATLLVNGAHAATAAAQATAQELPLGLHLNLSEGDALTGVSTLTDASGRFFGKFGVRERLATEQVTTADIAAEIRAQLGAFVKLAGRLPGHVDGHQHIHVHPRVAPLLAEILPQEFGVQRVRLPCEHVAQGTSSATRAPFHGEICAQARLAARHFAAAGLRFPDAFLGLALMGSQLSATALGRRLAALRAGAGDAARGTPRVVELMCHPGQPGRVGDAFNRSPERAHEQTVLASPAFAHATRGFARASFAALAPPPLPPGHRRFLIVSKLHAACGNHTTALDLAKVLAARGEVLLRPLPADVPVDARATAAEAAALRRFVADEQIDFVLGIHAYRCGALFLAAFADAAVPWALFFSGTDANQDLEVPSRRAVIGAALEAASARFSLSADMAAQVRAAFPTLPPPALLQPPTRITTPSPYSLRAHLGLAPTQRLILLPAGIRPVKDVRLAIDAAQRALRQHPDHVLVVVGPVLDADYAAGCDAAIAADPLTAARLLRLDGLARPDYLAALREADLLLNTSRSEGLPNALLEAMAAGVPILARDIPGNRALLGDDTRGLLFVGSDELLAGWSRLFADAPLRRRLIAAGRAEVRRRSRRAAAGRTLLRAVDALMAQRHAHVDSDPPIELTLAAGTHPPDAGNLALFRQLRPRAGGRRPRCLDMGAGSGLFGLALLERLHAHGKQAAGIVFADNDAASLDALASTLRRERDFFATRVADDAALAHGNLFDALPAGDLYDLIVANLPQTPAPHAVANDRDGNLDGAGPLLAFLARLPQFLAPRGEAFVLHIGLAHPARVRAAIAAAGLRAQVQAEEWRRAPLARYETLAPDLVAHLDALCAQGVCEARREIAADGAPALGFAVRLLRLRRRPRPGQAS